MRTKQMSWPLLKANVRASYEDEKLGLDPEAQILPREAAPARLKALNKLCDCDLDEQRFDRSLRSKISSATLASSCTTLCDFDASQMDISSLLSSKLPSQKGSRYIRAVRWRLCTRYRILFCIVFFTNLIPMAFAMQRISHSERSVGGGERAELSNVLTAVSINLTASIAIRNEHVINMLFRIFVIHLSPRAPLSIRRIFAKVYHFGGVHSGGGVAAVVWYGLYTAVSTHDFIDSGRSKSDVANMTMTTMVWLLMICLLVGAFPRIRATIHNWFETSHRFCGWAILGLFWAQTLLFCIKSSSSDISWSLIQIPTFWALIIMSLAVAYPWVRVKKVRARCQVLSRHAIRMHIDDDYLMQPCRVVTISHSPLRETHKFATIPAPNGHPGYSMVISRAGDWTARIINNPPKEIWIKGAPAWGVLRVATMFDPVVIVATGSGIGPCLGLFNGCPELNCRVIWQARAPASTYGQEIVDTVLRADRDALIVDTEVEGRKDMEQLAVRLYQESRAEAVIVISNTEGTYKVVRGLESRGIPAYGPIWDS